MRRSGGKQCEGEEGHGARQLVFGSCYLDGGDMQESCSVAGLDKSKQESHARACGLSVCWRSVDGLLGLPR